MDESNSNNITRIFYDGMSQERLEGYSEIHCRTDRALFAPQMFAQMIEYAGRPEGFPKPEDVMKREGFITAHEEMDELVRLSRERRRNSQT